MGKELLLKLLIVPCDSDWQAVIRIENIKGPVVLSFLNAHAFNLASTDERFRHGLLSSDYLLRDGVGVKCGLRIFGIDPGRNMNGTDLIPGLLDAIDWPVALFGTEEPYVSTAAEVIRAKGKSVVSFESGFLKDEDYVEKALASRPGLIILAMGMPKQERVSVLLKSKIDWPCLIVNGGAILDFISGRVQRAPLVFRKLGLEWLFRLCVEPKRLWRRYVIGNVQFLGRIVCLKFFGFISSSR